MAICIQSYNGRSSLKLRFSNSLLQNSNIRVIGKAVAGKTGLGRNILKIIIKFVAISTLLPLFDHFTPFCECPINQNADLRGSIINRFCRSIKGPACIRRPDR